MTSQHTPLSLVPRYQLGTFKESAPPAELQECCESGLDSQCAAQFAAARTAPCTAYYPMPPYRSRFCAAAEGERGPVDRTSVLLGPITRPRIPAPALWLRDDRGEAQGGVDGIAPGDGRRGAFRCGPRPLRSSFRALSFRLFGRLVETLQRARGRVRADGRPWRPGCVQRARGHSPLVATALDTIRHVHGTTSLETVASQIGISLRHRRCTVRNETGMALKTYARTVRFLRAMTLADRVALVQHRPAWSRLAADAGFFDQSHRRESVSPSPVARRASSTTSGAPRCSPFASCGAPDALIRVRGRNIQWRWTLSPSFELSAAGFSRCII